MLPFFFNILLLLWLPFIFVPSLLVPKVRPVCSSCRGSPFHFEREYFTCRSPSPLVQVATFYYESQCDVSQLCLPPPSETPQPGKGACGPGKAPHLARDAHAAGTPLAVCQGWQVWRHYHEPLGVTGLQTGQIIIVKLHYHEPLCAARLWSILPSNS